MNTQVVYKHGRLEIAGHDLERLARKHGTPLYVYSLSRIEEKLRALRSAFTRPLHVHYAMKANSNRQILRFMRKLGTGVDVVSGGEIKRALECGFSGADIIFSGVAKSVEEIELALAKRVHVLNVESPQELERIGTVASRKKRRADVSFRLNPNVNPKTHPYITTGFKENKFGMDRRAVPELLRILKKYSRVLNLVGLDFHIGSQLLESGPFEEALRTSLPLYRDLQARGFPLKYFDIGGGIGISYTGAKEIDINSYGRRMERLLKSVDAEILCEPGRFLVGDAGVLLTKVEYVKKTPHKTFVIVDTGMHHLIRPALYQAFHRIMPLEKKSRRSTTVDVVGPICESSDWLAQKRRMPEVRASEHLAVLDAGAYGFVMASDYNLRAKPRELVLK